MRSAQRVVKSLGISWRHKSWSTNSISRTSIKYQFHIRNFSWEVLESNSISRTSDEVRPTCSKMNFLATQVMKYQFHIKNLYEVPIPYQQPLRSSWHGVHLLIKNEVRPTCGEIPWNFWRDQSWSTNLISGTCMKYQFHLHIKNFYEVPIPYQDSISTSSFAE